MFKNVNITNPKIDGKTQSFTKYYAGYNSNFVNNLVSSIELPSDSLLLDPWNGIGTTTLCANVNKFRSIGCDINPVMAIYAKATLFRQEDVVTLLSLRDEIIHQWLSSSIDVNLSTTDPLLTWFIPKSVFELRLLEKIIIKMLLSNEHLNSSISIHESSSIVCFFYVAIFRTIRKLTQNFKSSNPTWIKKPKSIYSRIRPAKDVIIKSFTKECEILLGIHEYGGHKLSSKSVDIKVKSSLNTGILDKSVDLILTSPPYCTRIDYAISTQIELAFIGYNDQKLRDLRNKMIGTSTIHGSDFVQRTEWGKRVNNFLSAVYNHQSKASATYYYRSHYQYYDSMYKSIHHLSKDVLKSSGGMVMVVQDSYYKDIHNNLQDNLIEICSSLGLQLSKKVDFKSKRTMSNLNTRSMKYRRSIVPTESVLCFKNVN